MSNLLNFNFQSNSIRTFTDENQEAWFCGVDGCNVLGYTNSRKTLADHCKEKGVTFRYTLTKGGEQSLGYINEPNLFRLIIKSKKPEAEQFESWVMEEVLPSIRKTGSYSIEEPKYSKMSPEQQKVIESAIRQRAHVLATLVQPMYEHHMRTGKIVFKTHDDVQKWYPQDDPYLSPRAGIKLDPIEFPNMNTGNYPNDPHQQFSYESWIKMVHAQKSPIFKLVQQLEKQGYDVTTVWEEYALLGDLLSRMNQSFTFFRDHCSRPHTISFAPPGSKARKSGKRLFV